MVKGLLGHKTIEMTIRYSHLSRSHKSEAVERLEKSTGHQYGHQPQIGRRSAVVTY